ncbi:hypothetical protein PIB30_095982 [Stylosanthes scabra]|uniref:Uncharacterized protein n=1 Tax=Stylosanthes scabra TaxID=79078 RepID=A0ABU6VW77_9FABA|nr:hypothetical protein [Stylosanthes scabra]
MSKRRGRSRIPRVTRSSSPTDSTISFATSRPKRQCDLPHGNNHSNDPRPRSSCMRAIAYCRLLDRDANSQSVARQNNRVCSVPELPVRIHGSPSYMLKSSISNRKNQRRREATVLVKTNEEVSVSLFYDICTVDRVIPSLRSTFEG